MNVILVMSVFWTVYGIAGILGFQIIPDKFKGYDWTKNYVRRQVMSWLLLGIPWLVFERTANYLSANIGTGVMCLLLLGLAIPSIIFSFVNDRKYKAMLKNTKK